MTLTDSLKAAFAILALSLAASFSISCTNSAESSADEYFVGTNFWYGPILAGTGEGSDRARLSAELDTLKAIGITNLRVLAGADGVDGVDVKVSPVYHTEPDVYDEGLEEGLGYFLHELEKRDMKAVLYLNNAWEWSGGYGTYLEWAGAGETPNTRSDGYTAYMNHVAKFITNRDAQELYFNHIRHVVGKYKDSKAIYSWQIANEPRCFSDDKAVQDTFVNLLWKSAELIKSIDPDHMVSTGSEGRMGCQGDLNLCRRIMECPSIDYVNIHIWPLNWGWTGKESVGEDLGNAIENTDKYIAEHVRMAEKLGKKVIIEEFGYPRDGFQFSKDSTTTSRDAYYSHMFHKVIESAENGGALLGVNFWGWGGFAEQPKGHIFWEHGDDYCGDPSQEEQGLNSVYASDVTTLEVISSANDTLWNLAVPEFVITNDWLFHEMDEMTMNLSSLTSQTAQVDLYFVSDTTLMGARDTVFYVGKAIKLKAGQKLTEKIGIELKPGFYQVCPKINGKDLRTFNIGVEPEKIVSPTTKAEDFDAFWERNLAELEKVPMDARMEPWEEQSSPERNVYRVEYKSLGGVTVGGVLAMPNKDGKFPARVEYMGYGADVYPYRGGDNPELIQFCVSVRDQGLFRDTEHRWIDRGLEDKENAYYKGAYCDAVRAIDFVASLEKTDSTRIFGLGESQGGALTWVAASLDHRFRAIAPAVPFMSDFEDYGKIVWWPVHEVFEAADAEGLSREKALETLSYFDVKNFTDRITCPVRMAFGLQDPTCPPHTNFAGYNNVRTEKQFKCVPLCGHGMWEIKEWSDERDAWFGTFMSEL